MPVGAPAARQMAIGEAEGGILGKRDALSELASRAGFVTISLDDVFDGLEAGDIQIASFDEHPNEIGHQRIADVLYERLIERADEIGL